MSHDHLRNITDNTQVSDIARTLWIFLCTIAYLYFHIPKAGHFATPIDNYTPMNFSFLGHCQFVPNKLLCKNYC